MSAQTVKKTLNIVGNILFYLMLVIAVLLAFFLIKGKMEGGTPTVAGYKLYTVLSGSMSPVFDAGSVIAIKEVEPEKVSKGDIITFKDPEDQNKIITHRVIEINNENGALSFITKGDANDAKDSAPVPGGNIIGQATYWIPYAGYVFDFTKSKKGLLLLIVVPGALFILFELRNLFKYAKQYEEEEKRKKAELEASQINTET